MEHPSPSRARSQTRWRPTCRRSIPLARRSCPQHEFVSRTHTCPCTEARCDVGHRLECLRPGVVRTEPSGRTLPDWTEMRPSLRLRPALLACVNLTRSLSRLLFGFPRIPWLRLRNLTPSRGGASSQRVDPCAGLRGVYRRHRGVAPTRRLPRRSP